MLVDGPSQMEGRVQICLDGLWGTICDKSLTIQEARVICKQLGYDC